MVLILVAVGGFVLAWAVWRVLGSEYYLFATQRFIVGLARQNGGKIPMQEIQLMEISIGSRQFEFEWYDYIIYPSLRRPPPVHVKAETLEYYHDVAVHLLRRRGIIDVRRMHPPGDESSGHTLEYCLLGPDPERVSRYRRHDVCSSCDRRAPSVVREKRWDLPFSPNVEMPKCSLHNYHQGMARGSRIAPSRETLMTQLDQDPTAKRFETRKMVEDYLNDTRQDLDTESGLVKLSQNDLMSWNRPHLYVRFASEPMNLSESAPFRPRWLFWDLWLDLGFASSTDESSLPNDMALRQ